ncbi:hypothetical protein C0Q70_01652 [Pomacea canaliculata]|uniref:Uncharacterized protein n=1 Tax=Pomacea canaliculata TaxID=400727 RepID=A0A2T7Q023_POMCA|nr:hypothetical protein C0Q70_01652 [Pomacea canaliculata]
MELRLMRGTRLQGRQQVTNNRCTSAPETHHGTATHLQTEERDRSSSDEFSHSCPKTGKCRSSNSRSKTTCSNF